MRRASRFVMLLLWLPGAGFAASADPHTRTLAASCAACHGTNGNSVGITPVLAGRDATVIEEKLRAFRQGSTPSTVMFRHAKGLTESEITALAAFFAAEPRIAAGGPMPLRGE